MTFVIVRKIVPLLNTIEKIKLMMVNGMTQPAAHPYMNGINPRKKPAATTNSITICNLFHIGLIGFIRITPLQLS
jgi:hypothetical protein